MPVTSVEPPEARNRSADGLALALLATLASVTAFLYYFHRDAILLYGDAVAHINIARRVFDSRTPGLFELGTVWLPLPHLLDIPFIVNDWLWRTGVGATVPSMLAYVAGALGVFRLVRGLASRPSAWIAALIYALNPNLLYMQSTAMTESLYLALFIWTAVYFSEFARTAKNDPKRGRQALEKCAIVVSAAMLVRYDGWFLAAVVAVAAFAAVWRIRLFAWPVRRGLIKFLLLTGATAALWLAYNYSNYGNALEFANGEYSARAIQERSLTPTWTSYPGENSPRTAALYFLKVSRLNLGEGRSEYFLFIAAIIALLCAVYFSRQHLPWAVLWSPVIFYIVCVAWASVPIYHPEWFPFGYYNVRYGLQMLPAVAVFAALACEFLGKFVSARAVVAMALLITAWSCGSVWQRTPICLREAQVNGRARMEFDRALAVELRKLPPASLLLMDCGAHSGAVQAAGISFRRVLRESNPPLWEVALTEPARSADYIVAIDRDDVALAVRLFPQNLVPVAAVGTPAGPRAVIYHSTLGIGAKIGQLSR